MAAYPQINISRNSKIMADAGIRAEVADDDTIVFRKDRAGTAYAIEILHEWVTEAEWETIEGFPAANGYGPHTFTLHGIDFTITLINDPQLADRKGELYMVVTKAIGVKA